MENGLGSHQSGPGNPESAQTDGGISPTGTIWVIVMDVDANLDKHANFQCCQHSEGLETILPKDDRFTNQWWSNAALGVFGRLAIHQICSFGKDSISEHGIGFRHSIKISFLDDACDIDIKAEL